MIQRRKGRKWIGPEMEENDLEKNRKKMDWTRKAGKWIGGEQEENYLKENRKNLRRMV